MTNKNKVTRSKEPLTAKQLKNITELKKGNVPKDFGGERAKKKIEAAKAKDSATNKEIIKENAKKLGIKNTKLLDDATAQERAKVARALGVIGGFFGTLVSPSPAYKRGGSVTKNTNRGKRK